MDFAYSDEERLLEESVERLVAERYGFEQRLRHAASPHGWSAEMWAHYAELGLLALPFAEPYGGLGGGAVQTMIVMEKLGRALVLEPYFATVVMAGGLVQAAGAPELCAAILPEVAAGRLLLAFAHGEAEARYALSDVSAVARRDGEQWVLNGAKSRIVHGDCADRLVVSARVAGGRRDRDGIALFVVDADAPGVERRGYVTQDGLRAADIALADVRVAPEMALGAPGAAFPHIERAVQAGIAASLAETVGALDAAFALTRDYLATRRQFGRAIGDFQALRHRFADLAVEREQARGMMLYATMMLAEPDPAERAQAISAAKFQVGRAARFVAQEAVQLHGGIGLTNEYALGPYFKRLTVLTMQFGDLDHHLGLLADARAAASQGA